MSQPTAQENFMYALLESGTEGLRQIEIASPFQGYQFKHQAGMFWSSCLNTYVSNLSMKGVTIARFPDPYINQAGKKSNYTRYVLPNRKTAEQVLKLLNDSRLKRGAEPLTVNLALMLVDQFPAEENEKQAG